MCKKILTSSFISSMLVGAAMPALAVDTRTVTFNGKIIPNSCAVDVSDTSTNDTVTPSDLSQTTFGADKKVGDSQSFTIILTECNAAIADLNIKFDSTRVAGYGEEVLQPTRTATNLGIRMLSEGNDDYVKFGGSEPDDSLSKANGESVVFGYKAEVVQVGNTVPTTGDYTAQATCTLIHH